MGCVFVLGSSFSSKITSGFLMNQCKFCVLRHSIDFVNSYF